MPKSAPHHLAHSADALGSIKEQRARTNAQLSRVGAATTHGASTVATLLTQHAADAQRAQRTRADLTTAVEALRLLPPHNLDATSLQEAYPWKDVVPRAAWKAASRAGLTAQGFAQGPTDSHVSPFVLGRLQAIGGECAKHAATLLTVVATLLPLVGRGRIAPKVDGVAHTELGDAAQALGVPPEVVDGLHVRVIVGSVLAQC